ncbi:MAG: ribosome-associated translation inhibitor RaiA [Candidatus Moranbacteria bacterium]|jgi:ribosomal subunit interface protein|nr:ribosome-associated translation inhibitor RaiA [Candidatus Moranbacteria bacterium]
MKTRFLWKDMEASGRAQEYILKRLGEVSDLFDRVSLYEVETSRDKRGFFRVEVNVHEPKELHRAEETSKSIEGSIDMVIEKLRSQITRTKDKERELEERGARSLKKKTVLDESARF